MATPLGKDLSTTEDQVSQCDNQTLGSISEFRKTGAARSFLAKSSRTVSAETEKVLRKPTAVLWRNKEARLRPKFRTFKNLVVRIDQRRFEEVLSGGGLMLRAREHKKVFTAKVSNQNQRQNSADTPQPLMWLVRFLANLSILC